MSGFTHDLAFQKPTEFRLVLGQGYLYMGPLPPISGPPVVPAEGTEDGTYHRLAKHGQEVQMLWQGGLWQPTLGTGIRLAFPPDYLGGDSWTYAGPV